MATTNKKGGVTKSTTQTPLTETQLYDVLDFAREYYATANNYHGVYTPDLINNRLGEITLSPKDITSEDLQSAIRDPVANQDKLIGYSEWLQFSESVSKRTLGYIGNLLAFNPAITCLNIENDEDYHSEQYKKDYAKVKDFFGKFDCKAQFKYVHRRTLIDDSFYSVLRTDGDKYEFQELPHKYCKITGRNSEWGYLFDFDMNWFLRMGLSLDQYPAVFKRMYNEIFYAQGIENYDPSNRLTARDGTWALWVQTSPLPKDGNFACFKFNYDMYANIPFLTPLFSDAINKSLVRTLQNDQYIIASQKLLIGLIPLLKDQKGGQVKDAFAVDPKTMGKFLGVLAQGLANNINVKPVPFSDVKDVAFSLPERNMYQENNKSLASNSGVTSRLIYADDGMSATEVVYSAEIDKMIAESVYPQYGSWLSAMVNALTEKYKFKITFSGINRADNQKFNLDMALKLADKGMVDFQSIANGMNMDIFEFEERLSSSANNPLWGKIKLLPNANTASFGSASENDGGRPKEKVVSDSNDRNNDRMSNIGDGDENGIDK